MYFTLTGGRRMFYDVDSVRSAPAGSPLNKKPTLVFIHGSEVDHGFFKPWVSPLADDAQLVFVDLIGHGQSDEGDPDDWTLAAWADAVAELCAGIGVDAPVVLGSSLGGRIAMLMALRHERLMTGLIIANSVLVPLPERRIDIFRTLGGEAAAEAARYDIEHRSQESKERYMRLCMPLTVQRPYSSEELARLRPVSDQVMDALVRLSQAEDGLIGQVGWIECPTLVVTGELDPAAPPADAADLVAAIGRNAQLCVIAGAGHGVYRDQPAVFNEVVRTFLRGIAASLATP